ncbi:hypothetical protein FC52_GL000837 [Lactobacillus pasteurii DSM 23907 = CRBIP 24.76]|nr:hypothetical protein FC52_GL000837 [Lactobacillus pasteurii DSM 23907 = CRBIP 24.76]TDG76625.1 hypothetical protein C5L33_001384 [Lactobacillus pasteurii]
MELSHLLLNKLKWFNVADNADKLTVNGRSLYALPSKIKVNKNVVTDIMSVEGGYYSYTFSRDQVFNVIGAYKSIYHDNGKKRYIVSYSGPSGNYILSFSESDCTPIW